MKRQDASHCFIKGNRLVCDHCGSTYDLEFPITVDEFTKKINAFIMLHKDCKSKEQKGD